MPPATPGQLLVTFVELSLLAVAVVSLGLEQGSGLPAVVPWVVAGWVVHEAAPAAARAPVFVAVSIAVLVAHLGWDAPWVLVPALVLSELSHLPASLRVRASLVAVAAVGLAALRAGLVDTSWPVATLPILASMFMFRIVLVLADPAPATSRSTRWGYFLQWPNVVFPLYPIVDWGAWRRVPSVAPFVLHQRGLRWIARGLVHLLIYRLVYHLALPMDWRVVDGTSAVAWVLAGYVLYLRISGQFHLIVGFLLLFGRDLPETHHHFFFATSFNDYWRRVNIYWKDFVEKVVFYPLFLRLRRTAAPAPLVLAILATFLATWTLHSWQWFWLRGQPLLSGIDAVFWAALGVLVAANSWWTAATATRPDGRLIRSLKGVGMFTTLALMWSFWRSETLDGWLDKVLLLADPATLGAVAAVLAAAVALGTAGQRVAELPWVRRAAGAVSSEDGSGFLLATCALLAGLGVAAPAPVPLPEAARWLAPARAAIATEHLNEQDHLARTRGYYEDLLPKAAGAAVAEPWEAAQGFPPDWLKLTDSPFARKVRTPLGYELLPSQRGEFHRAPFETSSIGLRDKEYPPVKPPGGYRIALLGASIEMGGGVPAEGVFEALVEARFRRERGVDLEILNFAVDGYTLLQHVHLYPAKVRALHPDLVIVASHHADDERVLRRIVRVARMGIDPPNDRIRGLADEYGLARVATEEDGLRRLLPHADEVMRELYAELVREAARDGVKVAWLRVPKTRDITAPPPEDGRAAQARAAGMVTMDLRGAYGPYTVDDVVQAPWDDHPNELGHWLLAERFYASLVAAGPELGLDRPR